eukprot:17174-Chlamydomonas_euryale.AAC.1
MEIPSRKQNVVADPLSRQALVLNYARLRTMLLRAKPKHTAQRSDPLASNMHGRVQKPTDGRGHPCAKSRPAVTPPSQGHMREPAEEAPEDLWQVLPALARTVSAARPCPRAG